MLNTEDISVIVQGAINKEETPKCLKSVRKFLPNAEIILSTWEGSDVSALDGLYDILLLNKDPGAAYYYKNENGSKLNNLNRQLFSTQEGLKKASRTYAMKIRSDIILNSDAFLKYFDCYPKRDEKYSLFKHKILTSSICSRFVYNDYVIGNRIPEIKMAFHISDWWLLGLKEDIDLYFSAPLVKEPNFSDYYKREENKDKFNPYIFLEECYLQYAPEQYFAVKCFERNFDDIKIEHAGDITDEKFEQYRKYIINNFIFTEFCESGIYFKKHLMSSYPWLSSTYFDLYNRFRQQYEYKVLCDNDYKIDEFAEFLLNNDSFKKNIRMFFIHFHRLRKKEYLKIFFKEAFFTCFYFFLLFRYFPNVLFLSIKKLFNRLKTNNNLNIAKEKQKE